MLSQWCVADAPYVYFRIVENSLVEVGLFLVDVSPTEVSIEIVWRKPDGFREVSNLVLASIR
jgi:hypothetical protein